MSSPLKGISNASNLDPRWAMVSNDSVQLKSSNNIEPLPPESHEDQLSFLRQQLASLHQQLQILAAQNSTLQKTCMHQMQIENQARLLEMQVESLQHQLVVLRTKGEAALQEEIRNMAEREPKLAEEQFIEEVEEIILQKERPNIKRMLLLLQSLKEQEEIAQKEEEERQRTQQEYDTLLALDDWEVLEPSDAEKELQKARKAELQAKQEDLKAKLEQFNTPPEQLKARGDTNIAHLKELKELISTLNISDEEALLSLFPGESINPMELDFVIVEDGGEEIQFPGLLSRIYSKISVAESTFDQVNTVWNRVSKVKTAWDWGWWLFKYAGPVVGAALIFI